ncbi:mechanosensitive ion channel-like protein [Pseudomonas sp. SJZ079]|nr:mechanosensitive ion channel-like protein [Pseudomonas sp. SJZ079]
MEHHLRQHPAIHQEMTQLVRQLSPSADGLPLELYCFTNTTSRGRYERIQSDIFDHLLAILPEFNMRVFQHPSAADMRELGRSQALPTLP